MNKLTPPPRATVWVSRALEPIFPQFLDIQFRQLRELEYAMAAGQPAAARRLAHSIKGAAASYDLPDAADMAQDLETALVAADQQPARRLFKQLARYLTDIDIVYTDVPPLPER
ncbi:Hpt domain-containing protein [Solidesulfovibrio sp.]